MRTTLLFLCLLVLACAPKNPDNTDTSGSGTAAAASDPDVTPTGAVGLPTGYLGRVDRTDAQLSAVRYAPSGTGWNITTGPAHIAYSPTNRASGNYTASVTIEQLSGPAHREAFGIFFGGTDLDTLAQRYGYFVVAGTGEGTVRERTGATVKSHIAWVKNPNIPAADSAGKATYRMQVRVRGDSVWFLVNDGEFARLNKRDLLLQTDGVVGLRVNHNLNLRVSPVTITRP